MHEKKEFQQRLQKIEGLVQALEAAADQQFRAGVVELMQSVMALHGAGIQRMMELVFDSGEAGRRIIDGFAQDELVASLLVLYDLHPQDLEARVELALNKVRPYLRSHGGNIELVGIDQGVVRVKLEGDLHGNASLPMPFRLVIEEAIYEVAPDVTALEVDGAPLASGAAQLEKLPGGN
ncbi:MAG TPA: NifU family protein [Blastocatellia bacterium]|nr:NifU family protein [Blastocatellia bacterium]